MGENAAIHLDAFWTAFHDTEEAENSLAIPGDIRGRLIVALKKMPQLRTIISRPMPERRILTYANYPMIANVLEPAKSSMKGNQGLRLLFEVADQVGLKLDSLYCANETRTMFLACADYEIPKAVKSLRCIDLCIGNIPGNSKEVHIENFTNFMKATSSLRNLTLCFEQACESFIQGVHNPTEHKLHVLQLVLWKQKWPQSCRIKARRPLFQLL